jgi:hypothetical protein
MPEPVGVTAQHGALELCGHVAPERVDSVQQQVSLARRHCLQGCMIRCGAKREIIVRQTLSVRLLFSDQQLQRYHPPVALVVKQLRAFVRELLPRFDRRLRAGLWFASAALCAFFLSHKISSVRCELHDLLFCRWPDVPVPLRIIWPNELAVVIEDHPAVGVSHFERERGRVVEVRQVIARE